MRKDILIGILLIAGMFLLIALLSSGHGFIIFNGTIQGEQPASTSNNLNGNVLGKISNNLVLDTSLPKSAEKILIYKVVPAHYTRQDVITLAQKFNISTTDRIKEVDEGSSIASEDGTTYAIMKNSGSFEYTNTKRADTVNPLDVPGKLPTDNEAEKIATAFLKDRDLLPEGTVFIGTEHGKIYRLGEKGNDTVVWEDVEVWYGRMLNGLKVKGSQLSVAVGGNGDIIDYYANWRNYQPYKELPLKTPELAFEDLKIKGVAVGMNNPDKVSINEMYLAYHTKPGAEPEEYLEPVYVFKGNVIVDGKSVDSVEEYIPALTNNAVKELSSK